MDNERKRPRFGLLVVLVAALAIAAGKWPCFTSTPG